MSPTTSPPPHNSNNVLCARRHSPGYNILVRARKQRDNQYVESLSRVWYPRARTETTGQSIRRENRSRCSSLPTCVGEMPRKNCFANVADHRSILIHVCRLFLDLCVETRDAKNLLCMRGQIAGGNPAAEEFVAWFASPTLRHYLFWVEEAWWGKKRTNAYE